MSKNLTGCSGDFPSLQREVNGKRLVFLDGPGGTQVPETVINAISRYYRNSNSNTHGAFITSMETDRVLEKARSKVSDFLGAEGPQCISFGANMTSLNFALSKALGRNFPEGSEVVITQLDHEANRGPWLKLKERDWVIKEVKMTAQGTLDYQDLEEKVTEKTAVLAVGYASNALGTVNDLGKIGSFIKSSETKLVVDAVHYAPHFKLEVQQLNCDFLLCSAYKFYGPHVGILYCKPDALTPLETDCLITQEQTVPYKIETGTLNHAAVAGLSAALDYLSTFGEGNSFGDRLAAAMRMISRHEYELFQNLYQGLLTVPGLEVWGPEPKPGEHTPTISFTVANRTASQICSFLAGKNICAWDGHFYARRAIEKLGLLERGGVTRLGLSMYTTRQEVDYTLKMIKEAATQPLTFA